MTEYRGDGAAVPPRRDPGSDGGGPPPPTDGGRPPDGADAPTEPGVIDGGPGPSAPGVPTFPSEGGSRYDSDACGRDRDSESLDGDSLDGEESLDGGSDPGGSSFTITRRPDWSGTDLGVNRSDRPGEGTMASSSPAILSGLPATHRPFLRPRPDPTPRDDRPDPDRPSVPLCSLPSDALHSVSTYCRPRDWASVSCASRGLSAAGREIVAKVYRHAGRCALEVGSAWVSFFLFPPFASFRDRPGSPSP